MDKLHLISYERATERLSEMAKCKFLKDTFMASSILAYLFDVPNEKTMDDLLEYRDSKK